MTFNEISNEEIKKYLSEKLIDYNSLSNPNLDKSIYDIKRKYLSYAAYNDLNIIGGIYGYIDYESWLFIDLLYIEEEYRQNDIGTKLIDIAIKYAKENKCIGIRLTTWEHQALDFYLKNGFTIFGTLDNHPINTKEYYLKKELNI